MRRWLYIILLLFFILGCQPEVASQGSTTNPPSVNPISPTASPTPIPAPTSPNSISAPSPSTPPTTPAPEVTTPVTNTVAASPPVIEYFAADPSTINSGESCVISWKVNDATSVNIVPGVWPVTATGSATVNPDVTTTYTLTANNASGSSVRMATVTVNKPPPPPEPSPPPVPSITCMPGKVVTLDFFTPTAQEIETAKQWIYTGDFNHMGQYWQSDGTTVIQIVSDKNAKCCMIWVKDLYKETEEILGYKEYTYPHCGVCE